MSYQNGCQVTSAGAVRNLTSLSSSSALPLCGESWSIPLGNAGRTAGVVGALLAASLRGLNNDVYFRAAC